MLFPARYVTAAAAAFDVAAADAAYADARFIFAIIFERDTLRVMLPAC